jgi:hypothetical protein
MKKRITTTIVSAALIVGAAMGHTAAGQLDEFRQLRIHRRQRLDEQRRHRVARGGFHDVARASKQACDDADNASVRQVAGNKDCGYQDVCQPLPFQPELQEDDVVDRVEPDKYGRGVPEDRQRHQRHDHGDGERSRCAGQDGV